MRDNIKSKLLQYIVMTQMQGIGPVTQRRLLDICGDIDTCFEAACDDLTKGLRKVLMSEDGIWKKRVESFVWQREDENLWLQAEDILRQSQALGISIITYEDERYPDRFRSISDMPIVLYTKGAIRINEFNNSIGVVGARRCTAIGKDMAIKIAADASAHGIAVISGMAKGIDSYAHTAAVKSQGYTIAVLGNGANICYPIEHTKLYESIAHSGCILSEYPPDTKPREYYFPKRNRLIAALSDKLYIIDATKNSGARSTARNSKRYGREVISIHEGDLTSLAKSS